MKSWSDNSLLILSLILSLHTLFILHNPNVSPSSSSIAISHSLHPIPPWLFLQASHQTLILSFPSFSSFLPSSHPRHEIVAGQSRLRHQRQNRRRRSRPISPSSKVQEACQEEEEVSSSWPRESVQGRRPRSAREKQTHKQDQDIRRHCRSIQEFQERRRRRRRSFRGSWYSVGISATASCLGYRRFSV